LVLDTTAMDTPLVLGKLREVSSVMAAILSSCHGQKLDETHLSLKESDELRRIFTDKRLRLIFLKLWNKLQYPKNLVILESSGSMKNCRLREFMDKFNSSWETELTAIEKKAEEERQFAELTLADKVRMREEERKKKVSERETSLKLRSEQAEVFLRETYSELIASNGLDEKAIQALVYILARVNDEVESFPTQRNPSRLYDWATVRSSVTLPYPTLALAAENAKFDKEFKLKTSWGLVDNKFVLPKVESLDSDDSFWGKLGDLLTVLKQKVEYTATNDTTVPDLSGSNMVKNSYFGYVFIRLIELAKSPSSATIRTGKLTVLDNAKNDVDFVVLSIIYQSVKETYENLLLSPETKKCQRAVISSKTVPDGKNKTKTVSSTSYQGYGLAEKLCLYLEERVGKSPESEPFFRFIYEILKLFAEKALSSEDYTLPRVMFAPANIVVRRTLRHGPEVKSKNGAIKGNTYVPFSFAKSSECQEIPEALRKTLTATGATISKEIDSINAVELKEQGKCIPYYSRLVTLSYALSDDLRKAWQHKAEILLDISILEMFDKLDYSNLTYQEMELFNTNLAKLVVKTKPLHSDKTAQSALQAKIEQLTLSKKKSRKASS
jgi:hypothetical protein